MKTTREEYEAIYRLIRRNSRHLYAGNIIYETLRVFGKGHIFNAAMNSYIYRKDRTYYPDTRQRFQDNRTGGSNATT